MADRSATKLVEAQYAVDALDETILSALDATGRKRGELTVEDLAPVDQFHMGGLGATEDLMRLAGPAAGAHVLDVGGGLGGAARVLASKTGATVTVLDATREFCETGEKLTSLVGLGERVTFQHGDACAMPFADESFDLVWLQHASMNIERKDDLFAQIHRVLRPGGRLALHEVAAGRQQPIHFPVPWANDPSVSFLSTEPELRDGLAAAGFAEVVWHDLSDGSLDWWRQRLAAPPAPLGVHLVMGAATPTMGANMIRNLDEGRLAVVQGILERPT